MLPKYILPLADPDAVLETVGGKGAALARLSRAGLPVPDGFHITTAAYRHFVADNELQPRILKILEGADIAQPASLENASRAIQELFTLAQVPNGIGKAIEQAYAHLPGVDLPVAVRSSATAEDLPELSFAGQQETFLNVCGIHAVHQAVKRCWASLWTGRAISYRMQHGIDQNAVALAVVVQSMVPAESAGILFTANPLTGRRDEIVINAAWGLGEAIVGGKVTPDTIIADKQSGGIKQVEVASKAVMTVRTEEGTEERVVPPNQQKVQVLDEAKVAELVRLANQIEAHYGIPQDIEWCQADDVLYIVQSRPITALPVEVEMPELLAPTHWKLPKGAYMAMRNNIVELMADPLTPLFSTLGRSAINKSLNRLLAQFFGRPGMMPEEIIITVNGYAYYNGSLKATQIVRILLGSVGIMKRMFHGAIEHWIDDSRPRYLATVERWQSSRWQELSATKIIDGAGELAEASIDAYGALLSGVIPAAWISEALFTFIYKTFIKRRSDPPAPVYLLGFDSTPIQADKSLYNLAESARTYPDLTAYLMAAPTTQIVSELIDEKTPAVVDEANWREWQGQFRGHLKQYGHTIYNLDFANAVPADNPIPLIETCKMYLSGRGANPAQRQETAAQQRAQATQAIESRLRGLRLKWFQKYLAIAQRYAPLREDGLADIGFGYPLLRQMLHVVGTQFARAGLINQPDDIFWLQQDEVELAAARLERGEALSSMSSTIQDRKALWQAQSNLTPPLSIPNLKPQRAARKGKNILKGVAASPGRVSGVARVLHGPQDFDQMQPGDVLVAAITTPAWTPLFAMASAVVTDVGGPLSHGSIVAREYGIPAVLGTGGATRRIRSGQYITVDGSQGQVQLDAPAPAIPLSSRELTIEWKLPKPKGVYMRGSLVDLLPDPLSPLFESMGIPAAINGVAKVGRVLTRSNPDLPDDYFTTINGYAYMNAALSPRAWWWVIAHMLPSYPRMLRIMVPYWRDEALPQYQAVVACWRDKDLGQSSALELWREAEELLDAAMHYLGTLMFATMGASAGSEAMLTKLYEKLAKQGGDPPATALLMGYNSVPVQSEKSLYDLALWCQADEELAAYILATPSKAMVDQLRQDLPPLNVSPMRWQSLQEYFNKYLMQFGHMIYELDFAKPLPLDDPTPMLETVKMYLRGDGVNPHERQHASEMKRIQTVQAMLTRLKGIRRWAFQKSLNWAQSLAEVREDALSDIGLGYPLLRQVFPELGRRLSEAGAIQGPEDIYWLKREEIEDNLNNLDRGTGLDTLIGRVEGRKAFWRAVNVITPPPMLPMRKKILGFNTEIWVPVSESEQATDVLKGVGASAGKVTAPARVLHGPEDFDQMQPGDVLVAQITTPAWTPLFAMASAVVTDVGGPLSHGSIVAREYGIPAVMGTGVATRRIQSGQIITVDGTSGMVKVNGRN